MKIGGWTGTEHYTCMKYDRPSMHSTPVNRSRLTVKHDRPSIISAPMNSTVHQYTIDKYKVKVDIIKERLTAKDDRPSMYTTPVHRTVQRYTVHST